MTDFNKRYSAKHKAALSKVDSHLRMAKSAHGRGMSSLAEAAKCMVDAKKVSKAADDDEMARHLAAANGHFGKAASSMDDAEAHLNRALRQFTPEQEPLLVPRGYSRSESNRDAPIPSLAGAVVPELSDLTEGSVSQYDSVLPYPNAARDEKMAAATAFAKMMRTGQGRHVISKPSPRWR